jgi:hypothetical protein
MDGALCGRAAYLPHFPSHAAAGETAASTKSSQDVPGEDVAGHGRADFAPQLQFLIANHVASLELRV